MVCSAKSIRELIDQDIYSEDFVQMKSDISKRGGELYDFDAAYKLYSLKKSDIVAAYAENGDIKSAISEEFRWMVPTKDGNRVATILLDNREWVEVGYREKIEEKSEYVGIIDTDVIDRQQLHKTLDKKSKDVIIDLKNIWVPQYHMNFTYFRTETDEYLIPYATRPDFTGLKNGEAYEAKVAIETLKQNMPMDYNLDDDGGANAGAGIPLIENSDSSSSATFYTIVFTVAGVSVVLLGLGIGLLVVKVKKE